ncbi:phosphopantetheine-binding protein [Nocardia brasiliensis]|uniref:phosphopantetheine-binding protein n=1 Tax=Nocardia brasiliensis TaxID=37326 RepID=UPI0018957528|nr:phosphopantetheine-binding protein [Nocardia brasiliensis]MBF6125812.1 phosphopantetheine-binding protein [Nocardia brasiliensis]
MHAASLFPGPRPDHRPTVDLRTAPGPFVERGRIIRPTAVGDLGLGSVAVAIEERLGIRQTERELLSCWTIADMVELIDAAPRSAAGSAG